MPTLARYRAKRDFTKTAEPSGGTTSEAGQRFVVHKHAARRLHYDLRLELDGALKSWAVTKGPSLVPGEKRLAVHVEDHPIDYGTFEGTIPEGEYGAGEVIVWDRGTWTPVGDPHRGYAKGHIEFRLDGEKLTGCWHLVRMGDRDRRKRPDNWLLIKSDDDAARSPGDADILEQQPQSVVTGRTIEDVAREAPKPKVRRARRTAPETPAAPPRVEVEKLRGAVKSPLPLFIEPCLATPQAKPPKGTRWVHEIKFDGYRLQARIERGRVRLATRSGQDWTSKFGTRLIEALQQLAVASALLDGELVVVDESGVSDFSALQADLSEGHTNRFVLYLFDLMHLDGFDLRRVALVERKGVLQCLLGPAPPQGAVRYGEHFEEDGDLLFKHACRLGLEGIVSKVRTAPYRSGRGRNWLKSKCSQRQEFVIVGYLPSTASRRMVGSLVLGYYRDGRLTYAGRVGSGFSESVARDLWERLELLRVTEPPLDGVPPEQARRVRWVAPRLVAEVEYGSWTTDNVLRHAVFKGVRDDKLPTDAVPEEPTATAAPASVPASVRLTHPDRLYWPDAGITKQGLAEFYAAIWDWIAPHMVNRPLSLVRCPEGIDGECFFQKHAWAGLHASVSRVRDRDEELLVIHDLEGLTSLVQAGILEIHPSGATVNDLDRPDRLVLDLDPGEGVPWDEVIAAALEVRARLKALGLESFVKTSGGKGLHVVVPVRPHVTWDEAKDFTLRLAAGMAKDAPRRFTARLGKGHRKGRIYIDYLRNARGATAVAAYSTRARLGAPVSTPLAWAELTTEVRADHYRVSNLLHRLRHLPGDPWEGFAALAQSIPKEALKTVTRR
jgi:bifunctional non-homologous end joining protein LigD